MPYETHTIQSEKRRETVPEQRAYDKKVNECLNSILPEGVTLKKLLEVADGI